jgi:hypothetical protein
MPKLPEKNQRGLNVRQERFTELIASGMPATSAYLAAGYLVSKEVAKANASKLLTNSNVKSKIAEIRASEAQKSEFKREDMVRFLVSVLQTPVGELDASSPLAQEVSLVTVGKTTRKRVKTMGKIECARLLCEIMGWKSPEQLVVENRPRAIESIKERAANVASALDRNARLRARGQAAAVNRDDPSNGSGLSRWLRHNPDPPSDPNSAQ